MNLGNLESLSFFCPELILVGAILLVVISDISLKGLRNVANPLLTMTALVMALYYTIQTEHGSAGQLFEGMLALDTFGQYFKVFLLISSLLIILVSLHSSELSSIHQGEFFALLLAVTLGMILMANSINLVMLYLSLELVSLTSYVMVGYLRNDRLSNEASMKYILFGAVSTGSMLYGFSLLYGLTGSLNLFEIREALIIQGDLGVNQLTLLLVVVLSIAGFGFKTASVPFHFWCPDVYTGAPTPVTAFLSVAPKAAGFAILVRFFFGGFSQITQADGGLLTGVNWALVLIIISVITMSWGNIAALTQNNLKRMLAYSSIAHAGYVLMGCVVLTETGLKAILVYLFVYLFMNLGAFLVVIIVFNSERTFQVQDYNGMFRRSPFLAIAMSIFMLSLIGIPPFSGFLGKLYIFGAVIDQGLFWFAVIGALNAAVAAFYYMRVMKHMILESNDGESKPLHMSYLNQALIVLLLIPNVLLIVYWSHIDRWATSSTELFNGL
mgnify:CR=1 FL=1|tara:strand:+ start:86 stop:1576 length:1491 start_codon:yes stop_codon:yes gene_type:complete